MLPHVIIRQLDQILETANTSHPVAAIDTDGMDPESIALADRINTVLNRLNDAQTHLSQSQARLSSLNNELDVFAYVVSHDLKSPLRGISSLAQWIISDYSQSLDVDGREQLTMLNDRVMRMHTLIDGVLRFSRAGRGTGQCVVITLEPLIRQVVDELNCSGNAQVVVDTDLPQVQGDPAHLTQIFKCLLDNALKFHIDGRPEVHVTMKLTLEDWVFCVYDNGEGIPEHEHDRVFGLFQTVQAKPELSSSGVGLTIVKKIVNIYGGRVWFETSPIGGLQVCFTLPAINVLSAC